MVSAVDLLQQVSDDDEAHAHLHRECPWFRHVHDGGGGEPEGHCRPGGRVESGALVKVSADGVLWEMTPRTPEASTAVQPTVLPGGPGLFGMKGHHLPPYVEHLYKHLTGRYGKQGAYRVAVGVVKKWAAGVNPGGWDTKSGKGKRTHPDVRAAAQKNVAEWEQEKAEAHARHGPAGQHGDSKVKATAALSCTLAPEDTALAGPAMTPGAQAQYGLWQRPAATISPSPPLPPRAEPPTPAEIRALMGLVPGGAADASLSRTVRKFLETAAVKMEKESPLDALASLRGAQAAVYACHKKDVTEAPPFPWSAPAPALVPPAAQSSATSAMLQAREKTLAYRKLDQQVAALADRLRRNYFSQVPGNGVYGGPSQPARLSAVDRVVRLSQAR
jgi:hypothetical protein